MTNVTGIIATLFWLGLSATGAPAAEYRLKVVSLHETGFVALLRPGEVGDGASGPGLEALEARLDAGDFPRAAILPDRHLQVVAAETARAWGAVPLRVDVKLGGGRGDPWDEARWEGTPGEHSVWLVAPRVRPQEVSHVALKGRGALRHFRPSGVPMWGGPPDAVRVPQVLLRGEAPAGTLWGRFASRALNLGRGIAVVVGADDNPFFADQVWIVVRHGEEPTSYKVILAWRQRDEDIQTPTFDSRLDPDATRPGLRTRR